MGGNFRCWTGVLQDRYRCFVVRRPRHWKGLRRRIYRLPVFILPTHQSPVEDCSANKEGLNHQTARTRQSDFSHTCRHGSAFRPRRSYLASAFHWCRPVVTCPFRRGSFRHLLVVAARPEMRRNWPKSATGTAERPDRRPVTSPAPGREHAGFKAR